MYKIFTQSLVTMTAISLVENRKR